MGGLQFPVLQYSGGPIVKATVRITFENESKSPSTFEKTVEFTDIREPGGPEFIAQYLLANAEMETLWGKYWLSLPDVSQFNRPVKQTFRSHELFFGNYEDRTNTRAMWIEIANTLLGEKSLLAKSMAHHDVQQMVVEGSEAQNVIWHLHLDKMAKFDLASIFLGKVSDLAARLIFERLGASLIPKLDRNKPNWERDVTWSRILKGFADKAGNPNLASLTDAEYQEVQKILDEFLNIESGKRLLDYEHKLVHRITPSVDDPSFYTHLESRAVTPIIDEATGQQKGWTKGFGTMPVSAEYSFLDLYEDAVRTLNHYTSLLQRLEALPRFGPEAVATAAGK